MKMHNRSLRLGRITVHSALGGLLFTVYCLLFTIHYSLFTVCPVFAAEEQCLLCHSNFKTPAKFVHQALPMGCEICHQKEEGMKHPGQKGSIKLYKNVPELCYNCHENKTNKKVVHNPAAKGKCTVCHNSHMSDNTSLVVMHTKDYEIKHVNDLCVSCHLDLAEGVHMVTGPEGAHPTWKRPDPSRQGREMSCVSCHNPHSSDFPLMMPGKDICGICHKY